MCRTTPAPALSLVVDNPPPPDPIPVGATAIEACAAIVRALGDSAVSTETALALACLPGADPALLTDAADHLDAAADVLASLAAMIRVRIAEGA